MIMEYASGGEVLGYLEKQQTLNEIDTRKIILQLVSCMNYVHARGIVHRDLKLENVLFMH